MRGADIGLGPSTLEGDAIAAGSAAANLDAGGRFEPISGVWGCASGGLEVAGKFSPKAGEEVSASADFGPGGKYLLGLTSGSRGRLTLGSTCGVTTRLAGWIDLNWRGACWRYSICFHAI